MSANTKLLPALIVIVLLACGGTLLGRHATN